ncbi:MAG TPA: sugar phosphate isomerase/epimerase [Firmicutes bacterium]|nr:sugar phosphate isomerase/epimerase [Bacillota bacterium]HHY99080.1 sugar phosphate isomerase/epimerase [Bacillota bacterium]
MAKLHLGVNLCWARKRWPEPDEWMRLTREKLGLKYVEYCSDMLDPFFTSEPGRSLAALEIKQKAKEYGIVVFDYYTGLAPHCMNLLSHPDLGARSDALRWCEEIIMLASKMGASGIGGHFDTIPDRIWRDPDLRELYKSNLIAAFQYLSRVAKLQGLNFILWEQMYTPNEIPYTLDEAQEVYERANEGADVPIYLTVDVGHACCLNYPHKPEDNDPYLWLKRFAHISPVIHLQQTDGKSSHHWPFTEQYNRVGIIHPEKVVEAIEASGSKENYLMFEIFHSLGTNEEQLLGDLQRSIEYWREWVTD